MSETTNNGPSSTAATATEGEVHEPILSADNISVQFGGLRALSDVVISVDPGSIVGLIGPNGAGKSTLIGVLSGAIAPTAGRVTFRSTDVTGLSVQRRARLGIGRTFQHCELFADLTVREHMVLGWRREFSPRRLWLDLLDGSAWRKPQAAETDRVDHLLVTLGLEELAGAPVTSLPFGVSKLVELGRALAAAPRLVLLDEPFAGLDAAESARLATALTDVVTAEDVGILLVDHDVDTVLARSARVFVIDAGAIIASGTAAEIRSNEDVRRAYLGEDVVAPGVTL